jgi:hypothetical protein
VLGKASLDQEARALSSNHLKRTVRKALLRGRPKLGISDARKRSRRRVRSSRAGNSRAPHSLRLPLENQRAVQWRPDEPVVRVSAAKMRECLLVSPATRACCADRLTPTVRDHAESSAPI